ncbi:hypothetical protein NG798_25745 [Ancylothrix sp. C2]|uniref:hypothetical protein n=1 Tax=Ancylothrix sp. D3o TaxID=2953691 RepID=UPI0021BACEF2|nr:hypothetical protein [Ancylothrix sp. D3o]MCT7953205.1 hypothetical protein [Ancylothrix sp. D3o]
MPLDLGNLNDGYISIDYVERTGLLDTYKFNRPNAGAVEVSAQGFSDDIDINLKNCKIQVIKTVSVSDTNPAMVSDNKLSNPSFSDENFLPAKDSNSIIAITSNSQVNLLSGRGLILKFLVRKLTRKIGVYFAYNDGFYQDELAILPI